MALRILPITAIKAEVAVLNACKNSQAKLPVKISEFIRRTSGVYEDLEKMFLPLFLIKRKGSSVQLSAV